MLFSKPLRVLGRSAIAMLTPWRAVRRDIDHLRSSASEHEKNIHYIRDLAHRAGTAKPDQPAATAFREVMRRHSPAAIEQLKRRFLLQKRFALGLAGIILVVSACAIANRHLLAIATIVSSMPLLFMACLSSHFRLWQLRKRRLSKEEHGGLDDFFAENPRWIRQVLDPELGNHAGDDHENP